MNYNTYDIVKVSRPRALEAPRQLAGSERQGRSDVALPGLNDNTKHNTTNNTHSNYSNTITIMMLTLIIIIMMILIIIITHMIIIVIIIIIDRSIPKVSNLASMRRWRSWPRSSGACEMAGYEYYDMHV